MTHTVAGGGLVRRNRKFFCVTQRWRPGGPGSSEKWTFQMSGTPHLLLHDGGWGLWPRKAQEERGGRTPTGWDRLSQEGWS